MVEHQVFLWMVNPRVRDRFETQANRQQSYLFNRWWLHLSRQMGSWIESRGDRKKFAPPLLYVGTLGQSILSSDTSTQPASYHFQGKEGN